MKVTAETNSSITTNFRRIYLEDGPIIGAGDMYIDGTEFQAEQVVVKWLEGSNPELAMVRGRRVHDNDLIDRWHERSYKIDGSLPKMHTRAPGWLIELLK